MAAAKIALEQATPTFVKVDAAGRDSLIASANRMDGYDEEVSVVGRAAVANCSKWKAPMREGLPAKVALETPTSYSRAFRQASAPKDELWTELKTMVAVQLVHVS